MPGASPIRSTPSNSAPSRARADADAGVPANMVRAATAELVGTFLLVLVGTSVATAAILGRSTAGPAYDSLAIALAFGLVLVALVGALGHTSGCHVNPAVTLGLASIGKFPWRYVPAYLGAQLVGAVLASLALLGAYGARARTEAGLGAPAPNGGATALQTFLMEALIGFLLVFVVVAVTTDSRVTGAPAAVCIGFALAAGVLVAGPVSGGAANPVRALGPMIVDLQFPSLLSYVVAPVVGGVLAAVFYQRLVGPTSAPDDE